MNVDGQNGGNVLIEGTHGVKLGRTPFMHQLVEGGLDSLVERLDEYEHEYG